MNKLKYIFGLAFFLFSFMNLIAQKNNENGVHSMIIFEYQGNGRIEIDKNGDIDSGKKISLKKANKKIEKFVISKGYRKNEASNNPPPPVELPTEGKKNTYIIIVLEKDFIVNKNITNTITYTKMYKNAIQEFNDYDVLNLFSKKDKEIILSHFKK